MAPASQTGEGWSRPSTAERRGMETSRYRRAEMDGIAPTPHSGGEGWSRPSTAERRGMESSRYRRAERDGIAPTPQSGEG